MSDFLCNRSATEVVEGTSTEDEPLPKKIRTVEVCLGLKTRLFFAVSCRFNQSFQSKL